MFALTLTNNYKYNNRCLIQIMLRYIISLSTFMGLKFLLMKVQFFVALFWFIDMICIKIGCNTSKCISRVKVVCEIVRSDLQRSRAAWTVDTLPLLRQFIFPLWSSRPPIDSFRTVAIHHCHFPFIYYCVLRIFRWIQWRLAKFNAS